MILTSNIPPMHLDERVGSQLGAIQANLRRLDRTLTDLSQVQRAAARNTEQFSRLFYGMFVTLRAVRFAEAPDPPALDERERTERIDRGGTDGNRGGTDGTDGNRIESDRSDRARPENDRAEPKQRYRPLPPAEAVLRHAATSRVQKPSKLVQRPARLARFFSQLKLPGGLARGQRHLLADGV